jgi:hypothetical protein
MIFAMLLFTSNRGPGEVWRLICKVWADPVWSKVISAGIIATFIWLAPHVFWAVLWGWLVRTFEFFDASTEVSNWLLGILVLGCGATLVGLSLLIVSVFREQPDPLRDYHTDCFLSMIWRWKYASSAEIYDLIPFCPNCDFQIVPRFAGAYRIVERYSFHCEDCRLFTLERDEYFDDTLLIVKRSIHKKIRSGEWLSSISKPN